MKLLSKTRVSILFLSLIACASLWGCKIDNIERRHSTAERIAAEASMTHRIIDADLFNLTIWERVKTPGAPINIYIEGDGLAWVSKYRKSMNPTPPDPLTLRLATLDKNDNVIYIARPCQYSGWNGQGPCPSEYWTNARTAPEVLDSFMIALNHIKLLYKTKEFNLIGYSGGAAIALLVSSKRNDVASIRTVAGNIHHAGFTKFHNVSLMFGSIDPITVATSIAHIPQIHFVGSFDKVVPIDLVHDWAKASEDDSCISYFINEYAEHGSGWAPQWPKLLAMQPVCIRRYDSISPRR